jgi:2'-5' RNA ligase
MKNSPPKIRCFIAIELNQDAREQLSRIQKRLKASLPGHAVRWTPPANVHLTLHFLGDVQTDRIDLVGQILQNVGAVFSPFSLTLANLGTFPNTRRPRIVWVSVSGETERLVRLQTELGTELQKGIGFRPESRPYSPHLTIGRVKKDIAQERLHELGRHLEAAGSTVGHLTELRVERIHLIRSDLTPAGPIYSHIHDAVLADSIPTGHET